MTGTCELCLREEVTLTKHHLIPKARHNKRKNKESFEREEVRTRLLLVCRSCHNQIHATLSEKELEFDYNTLEKLLAHPDVAKYVAWVRKRNISGKISVKKKRH